MPTVKIQEFLTSGTWIRPSGVTHIHVIVVGGGGGGGKPFLPTSSDYMGSGGGGGGQVISRPSFPVTGNVTVTVGAGGLGATTSSTDGADGSQTSFGTLVVAGGRGGHHNRKTSSALGYQTDRQEIPGGQGDLHPNSDQGHGGGGGGAGGNGHPTHEESAIMSAGVTYTGYQRKGAVSDGGGAIYGYDYADAICTHGGRGLHHMGGGGGGGTPENSGSYTNYNHGVDGGGKGAQYLTAAVAGAANTGGGGGGGSARSTAATALQSGADGGSGKVIVMWTE